MSNSVNCCLGVASDGRSSAYDVDVIVVVRVMRCDYVGEAPSGDVDYMMRWCSAE